MIRVGSMQSNDLLVEYESIQKGFVLINTVASIQDSIIKEMILEQLDNMQLPPHNLTVYYSGANIWVIKARIKALRYKLAGG